MTNRESTVIVVIMTALQKWSIAKWLIHITSQSKRSLSNSLLYVNKAFLIRFIVQKPACFDYTMEVFYLHIIIDAINLKLCISAK